MYVSKSSLIGVFLVFFSLGLCLAQETVLNALDLYNPQAAVSCKFITQDDNAFRIYAILEFNQPLNEPLWAYFSLDTEEGLLNDSTLMEAGNSHQVLEWTFPDRLPNFITVKLNWNARVWIYQEHFPLSAYHSSGGISLWRSSMPLHEPWIHIGDSIQVRSDRSSRVYTYFYGHDFEPARPPMAVNPAQGGAPLSIDSVFVLPAGQSFSPDKQGLYLFQADSSGTSGVSLLVADRQFPQPREIKDLTEPLIYISTRREFQTLKEDLSSKPALDKFWLSTLESPETARAAIKSYYQNVEEANLLFTSYKEGWKTDRGMIYIILGRPITVKKGLDTETWSYRDIDGDEMNFQFKKVSNIFSNNHYELFRDKAYDRTWFVAIDRWRDGRIQ